jgi:uncharacterized membrane protein
MGWLAYARLSAVLAGLVAIFGKIGVRGMVVGAVIVARS